MTNELSRISGKSAAEIDTFLKCIDASQDEFTQGRPDDFKALWSHTDTVTLSGGHGAAIERGWVKVAARLEWASSTYLEGDRSNEIVGGHADGDFAYVVRKEVIEARIGGNARRSRQELRVTMVFRRGAEGWRIVHRHADSQAAALSPP